MMGDSNVMFIGGETGEFHIKNLLEQFGCKYYHNIYFKNDKGDVCQVDFVVVLKGTLTVIEVKNFTRCAIYGNSKDRTWTANYRSGPKKFYNPIMQNEKHIQIIKECVPCENLTISNVIVFASGSSLNVDTFDNPDVNVVDIASLWYLLVDLKSKAKEISKSENDAIIERLNYFNLRYRELYEEHKKYFKGR